MSQKLLIISIPLTFILGSCSSANIKAAQNLAKLQDTAKIIFPQIANDAYQSCLRSADLTLLNTPTVTSGQIDKNRQEAKKNCEDNVLAASQAINNVNKVILEYLSALGKLAANNLTNFDSELDSIGTSLHNLPGINTDERKEAINAGSAITKFLFRAFTDGYRREQLKLAVTTANNPLQILVTALDKSIRPHYINGLLENEQVAIDNYYKNYLEDVLTAPSTESVSAQVDTITEQDRNWRNTNKTIQAKKFVANGYLNLLKKIANDHQALNNMYVKGEEPSSTQVKQMVNEYSKQLKSLNEKSEKLFPQK